MVKIKAIIMAGGMGTRLRPLTCGIPKPLVPIFDKPVLGYILELLKEHNIFDIGITLSYLPRTIIDYFGQGEEHDLNIQYFIEETALGTGGSVKNTGDFIDSSYIVISGDSLTDLNLTKAVEFHKSKCSKATIILKRVPIPIEYGVVITDLTGRIIRFLEKPSWGEVFSDTVNTGIYILEPEVLKYYKKGDVFDFSKDLFPKLLKDGTDMYGYITDDYWCDIGDLPSYRQVHFDILDDKVKLILKKNEIKKGIWIGENVFISSSAKLKSPLYIGHGSVIENNAYLDSYSVISSNCKIGEGSRIKRSILWKNSEIGDKSNISGSVICSNTLIKNKVNVFENTVVGQGSILMDNSIVKPEIKIWPEKKICENTIVTQNLVWGTKSTKNIFGVRGISGLVNKEITPEFCSGLGSAFALSVEDNAMLVISSDNKSQSNIVKNSIVSGISSVGGLCIKISNSITPMARFGINYHKVSGGLHIYTSNKKPFKTYLELFDSNGINIGRSLERKIENLLNSGDFNRCKIKDVKTTTDIENFKEVYVNRGINLIPNIDNIKIKNYKIILTSLSESIITIASTYLNYLGCSVCSILESDDFEILAENIVNEKADIGIIISENGEKLVLIDEKGKVIYNEELLLLTELVAIKGYGINKLVFPNTFPTTAEEIASIYGKEIVRTPSNISSIMNKILEINEKPSWPPIQYLLNYDAVWALGYILGFLAKENLKLSEIVEEIPKFYYIKKEIPCDWIDKGKVIRKIANKINEEEYEMIEGVKIKDNRGWAMLLPDNEKPVFNIYTQGITQEMAKELSADLTERVFSLLKKQGFTKNK